MLAKQDLFLRETEEGFVDDFVASSYLIQTEFLPELFFSKKLNDYN